jgi:predicted GTPase
MGSRVRKSRRPLTDEELRSSLQKEAIEEHLDEILENVYLKNVPLEERRREAQKPLFLTRYE